jgi:hypothetical protein
VDESFNNALGFSVPRKMQMTMLANSILTCMLSVMPFVEFSLDHVIQEVRTWMIFSFCAEEQSEILTELHQNGLDLAMHYKFHTLIKSLNALS